MVVDYNDSYFCIAFGTKLQDLRRSCNFTRHGLAKMLCVDRDFINSIELGVTGILCDAIVDEIAQKFGLVTDDLKMDVSFTAQMSMLVDLLENYFDVSHDKAVTCGLVFSQVIQNSYRCAVSDIVYNMSKHYQCCDTMLSKRLERQATVPSSRELQVLKQVCDCFVEKEQSVVRKTGGMQDDRDEFNLDEIVESVVVDHAVCFGEDAFVYVDEDYFNY